MTEETKIAKKNNPQKMAYGRWSLRAAIFMTLGTFIIVLRYQYALPSFSNEPFHLKGMIKSIDSSSVYFNEHYKIRILNQFGEFTTLYIPACLQPCSLQNERVALSVKTGDFLQIQGKGSLKNLLIGPGEKLMRLQRAPSSMSNLR